LEKRNYETHALIFFLIITLMVPHLYGQIDKGINKRDSVGKTSLYKASS